MVTGPLNSHRSISAACPVRRSRMMCTSRSGGTESSVKELAELHRTMAPLAGADHPASRYVKGREQVGGSVPSVVVSTSLDLAWTHGQQRRGTVQRLDTRFFVYAQYKSLVRWVEVQSHDVSDLLDEERIGGQLEGLCAMRLKRERSPDTADGALAHAGAAGHRTSAPVSSVVRCHFQCQRTTFSSRRRCLAGSAGPRFVQEPIQASFEKPTTPLPHGLGREPHLSTRCLLDLPSAQPSINRARWASACAVFRRATNLSRVSRSSMPISNGANGLPRGMTSSYNRVNSCPLLYFLLTTHDTSRPKSLK